MAKENDNREIFDMAEWRMYSALCAFYTWKWLEQAINIHNAGEDTAKRNVGIINNHKYFLRQVFTSSYKSFISDLSIFFDAEKYEDNLTLNKLLKTLENKVTPEKLDELRGYISEIKKQHGVSLALILELRNSDVAHQSIKVKKKYNRVNFSEIEELFNAVQEILNLISRHYDKSVSGWGHVESEVSRHLKLTFDNLERGEKVRKENISKKWNTQENQGDK